jgi:hypothetical protein
MVPTSVLTAGQIVVKSAPTHTHIMNSEELQTDGSLTKGGQLSWLLGAAGVTGALVALGYTVRVAQGDLLGVSMVDTDQASYLLTAGGFVSHTLLLLLNWRTGLALVLGTLLVTKFDSVRRHLPSFLVRRSHLAIVWIFLCALHFLWFIRPLIPINRTLTGGIFYERNFALSKFTEWRTEQTWHEMVCSRVSKDLEPNCGSSSGQNALNKRYVWAVLIAGWLWMLGWRVLSFDLPAPSKSSKASDIIPVKLSQALLIASLVVTVLGIACLYGKTMVQSTTFPAGEIGFGAGTNLTFAKDSTSGTVPENSRALKPNKSQPAKPQENKAGNTATQRLKEPEPSLPSLGYGYVLAGNSVNVALYAPEYDVVLDVRTSAIDYAEPREVRDVL